MLLRQASLPVFYICSPFPPLASLIRLCCSSCATLFFFSLFLSFSRSKELFTMLNLNYFTAAAAALTLVSGVNAGSGPILMGRNQEPSQPSCTNFTPFKYAGCFKDLSAPRALLFSGPNTQNMTVETCVAFCKGTSVFQRKLQHI